MLNLTITALFASILFIGSTHASESESIFDEPRPQYCGTANIETKIQISAPVTVTGESSSNCGAAELSIRGLYEASCFSFTSKNPGGECKVLATGSVPKDARKYCQYRWVIGFFRAKSPAELKKAKCDDISNCGTLAYEKNDFSGLTWAEKMNWAIGCIE